MSSCSFWLCLTFLWSKLYHEWKNEWKVWQISSSCALSSLFFLVTAPWWTTLIKIHPLPYHIKSPFSSHSLLYALSSLLLYPFLRLPPSSLPSPLSSPSLFPPTAPAWLWLCPPRSLCHDNCSPLARALLWSRPPSSCFLSPPAEWVSDWPRETSDEQEEEVTLSFNPSSLYAWWHVSE